MGWARPAPGRRTRPARRSGCRWRGRSTHPTTWSVGGAAEVEDEGHRASRPPCPRRGRRRRTGAGRRVRRGPGPRCRPPRPGRRGPSRRTTVGRDGGPSRRRGLRIGGDPCRWRLVTDIGPSRFRASTREHREVAPPVTESAPLFSTGGTHQAPGRHPGSRHTPRRVVTCRLRLRTSAGIRPASPPGDFMMLGPMVAARPRRLPGGAGRHRSRARPGQAAVRPVPASRRWPRPRTARSRLTARPGPNRSTRRDHLAPGVPGPGRALRRCTDRPPPGWRSPARRASPTTPPTTLPANEVASRAPSPGHHPVGAVAGPRPAPPGRARARSPTASVPPSTASAPPSPAGRPGTRAGRRTSTP